MNPFASTRHAEVVRELAELQRATVDSDEYDRAVAEVERILRQTPASLREAFRVVRHRLAEGRLP